MKPDTTTTFLAAILMLVGASAGCNRGSDAIGSGPVAWTLTDTAAYGPGAAAHFAVLQRGDMVVDTVDANFGIHIVGIDSVVFLPVESAVDSTGVTVLTIGRHILYDGTSRTPVADLVPHFDSRRSAPAVMDGALLYWGLHDTNGVDSVKAVRYEFRRKRLNVLPLPVMDAGDDVAYFVKPHMERKEIVFRSGAGRWAFRVPRASQ